MGLGGSFSEKDVINILPGGGMHNGYGNMGGGYGMGGGGCILTLLLIAALGGGRGGLFGNGVNNGAAEAFSCESIKTAISTSTGIITNANDKNTASLASAMAAGFSGQDLSRAEQTANLTSQFTNASTLTQAGITRLENLTQVQSTLIGGGFSAQAKSFSELALQDQKDKCEVLGAINNSTNVISKELCAGFSALSGQNAQLFNAIKDLGCKTDAQFVETNCNIKTSKLEIISRIDKFESDAAIAARDARIRDLEKDSEHRKHNDTIVNVNNNVNANITSIQNQLNTLVAVVSRMASNGNGNGN